MGLDQLMIWRFRNIEGVLADVKSWNMNECIFTDGSSIKYDLKNDKVTVDSKHGIFDMSDTMTTSACTKQLLIDKYGFRERFDNRHTLSFGKIEDEQAN